MQKLAMLTVIAALGLPLFGTTLQQLSLDEMIQKSTSIVRGKAQQTASVVRGSIIYTYYRVQVSEQWKGTPAVQVDVAVPGGSANGSQQTYSGSPAFANGQEYIFFLWTSRTRLTQVIGLSQGLFNLSPNSLGQILVTRPSISDKVMDANGHNVTDSGFSMELTEFKDKVSRVLAGREGQ